MNEVPLYEWRQRPLLSAHDLSPAPPQTQPRRGCIQGYLADKKLPTPQDHHRSLGIVLLYGPRRKQFLMSEVPLYSRAGLVPAAQGSPAFWRHVVELKRYVVALNRATDGVPNVRWWGFFFLVWDLGHWDTGSAEGCGFLAGRTTAAARTLLPNPKSIVKSSKSIKLTIKLIVKSSRRGVRFYGGTNDGCLSHPSASSLGFGG